MVPSSLLNFGTAFSDLKKNYSFSYLGAEEGRYVLLLTPRKKPLWKMRLWIDAEKLVPTKALLEGDNVTVETITSNYAINPPIDEQLFRFKAPPGTEVMSLP